MSHYSSTAIIFNPKAGKLRKGRGKLDRAAALLREAGYHPCLIPTTGPGTAGELARRAIAAGADLVLAAGGDGTLNETLEGVVGSGAALGVLPAGTANVLACEMGLAPDMERAAAQLAECRATRISAGRLTPAPGEPARHFLLMCGIGLDAHVVYHVSAPLKAKTGKFAYYVAGFSVAGRRLEEFEVTADGRRYRASFALLSKVRNYGGEFEIARDTSLFEDRFEVVLFEGARSVRYFKYLAALALRMRVGGMRGVTVLRAHDIAVAPAPDRRVYIQIDGEFAGHLPARVEIVPEAVDLLIPPGYYKKHGRA